MQNCPNEVSPVGEKVPRVHNKKGRSLRYAPFIFASKAARRNYADMKTIDQYTQELNRLIKCEMTCKGVNQTIPMSMVTTKFGVDYWSMPALKFSDENGFVPFTELLDKESIEYGFNIIDHAVEPMQQGAIVVRQLVQFFMTIAGNLRQREVE